MNQELDALRRRFSGHVPGLMAARRNYAVLCPLVETPEGLHLLFEVRAAALSQGGEVCFPGGRAEGGETAVTCALRETAEELSIPSREITLLGTPDFICSPLGVLIQPVLGLVSPAGAAAMRPSPAEVAEVFTVPFSFFRTTPPRVFTYTLLPQQPEGFPYEELGISRDYPWAHGQTDVPVWRWENHVIWGLTARIVRELVRKEETEAP